MESATDITKPVADDTNRESAVHVTNPKLVAGVKKELDAGVTNKESVADVTNKASVVDFKNPNMFSQLSITRTPKDD